MEGLATVYSGTTLTVNVTATGGSGTHSDWNINLVGQPGTNGVGSGTVTSVAFSGGMIAVTNPSAAASMTVAGTSGGIPYFSSASSWASSGALAANGVVLGGGAGSAPTVTSADSTATHALFATAGTPAFRAIAPGDIPILNQSTTGTASNVTGTVGVANGGTGTGSTLTGLVRGSASAMTAAELSGDVTTSGSNAVTIAANAVGSSKMAVVNARRTCLVDNDSQSATVLTAAQITGRCEIPFAAHIVEVGVWGGTGTGGTQAYTGTSSVQLTRYRPSGATTATILSASLATPGAGANKACALATTSGTCIDGLTSSSSVTLAGGATVAVNAGDVLYVSTAAADGVQTWYTITIVYTVD
jgi:hypothetical protein